MVAILGLALSFIILFVSPAGDNLAARADVSTAVATMFALFAAIAAVTAVVWIESSDYRAEQAVKADTAQVRAALRSIMVKWAVLQRPDRDTCLDIAAERKVLNDFLSTTTAFGYWSWAEERGEAAEEGTTNEPWRAFFLYIAYLLDASERPGDNAPVDLAVQLEDLLADLTRADINKISSYVADLAGVLGRATDSTNPVLRAVLELRRPKMGDEAKRQAFEHLKRKGVNDPNVDFWLAVFTDDREAMDAAVKAGADTGVGDLQVLGEHTAELADFDPDQPRPGA